MNTRVRKPGEFCWINMVTPNPAEAREFFGKLLGWTFADLSGMGHSIKVGGRDVGGLFDLNSPQTPPDTKPMIGVMVKVENADATCARVASLGGKAQPPFPIADRLRMAVCYDPDGANFDLFEPKTAEGTDVDATLHGAPSWFEVVTPDVKRAGRFYSEVFGWSTEDASFPGKTYLDFKQGDAYVAGALQIEPTMMKPQWGVYFTADDVDETARLAQKLGGKVFFDLLDIPNVGRMCGIASPQGVPFYTITYND
jgi:predicted enzyme related to lactoylglutathione lyase